MRQLTNKIIRTETKQNLFLLHILIDGIPHVLF